jgi:hypothetical protein
MSEPIPESIPTSADPRSKRPLKRARQTSPHSQTASQIDALFSKPEQHISIPSTSSSLTKPGGAHVPEIVQNVQGSSAGAGSGEFHVYKASRRREYERLRSMEEEVKREEEGEKWERERREREERDREVTRRKREKRERAKAKNKKGSGNKSGGVGEDTGEGVKKVKARVELKPREQGENDETGAVAEEVGIVIHDDDD